MDSKSPPNTVPDPGRGRPRAGGGMVGIAIRQPVFTIMVMIGMMVLGYFSLRRLAIDEYPDVAIPILTIQTVYRGASPEVVERQVTKPIEEAVNTTQGIKKLTSQSLEGVSLIIIEFELGTDIGGATAEVRSKIEQTRRLMPLDIDTPIVQQVDISQQPVVSLALFSTNLSIGQLSTLADNEVRHELEGISGIGRVQISGGLKREIHVLLNPNRMYSLGVSAGQVIGALRSQNLEVPAGHIESGNREYLVRVVGNIRKPEDFASVVVANMGAGGIVRLSQIAQVLDTTEEPRAMALVDGKRAVGIDLLKVGGANTVKVAEEAQGTVKALQEKLPAGVTLSVIRDNSVNIRDSVLSVRDELLMGAVLTVAIVFLFLNDGRATLITSFALPVSVISTFVIMQSLGFTLNTMTLLGLSLSIGLLVDDAIVVIESAVRHREGGKDTFLAALEGTHEIFLAVLASTLTIVAVFVPVAFMGGIIGKFFFQFGLTISWSIMVSLFVSFTLTPMLAAWWSDDSHSGQPVKKKGWFGRSLVKFNALFDRLATAYRGVISWALTHRKTTLFTALLSFAASMALFPHIGGAFMPKLDGSDFMVDFNAPGGSSFAYTTAKAQEIAQVLKSTPEVRQTYITVGAGAAGAINKGQAYVKLSPSGKRKMDQTELMEYARKRLARIYGVETAVSAPSGPGAGAKPIQISITGPQIDTLDRLASQVVSTLKKIQGAIEIDSSLGDPKPEIRLDVDFEQANDLQLDASTIANSVQPLLGGQVATRWNDPEGNQTDVLVRLPLEDRRSAEEIGRLPIQRMIAG
ncbi:MAG TPA: efflux RND transporter permease subunit, partial [Candidatus Limnocylindria bacterium]|nr:efflux RND transporter permease subunit [Candidatus Limnocylindria bacterium]